MPVTHGVAGSSPVQTAKASDFIWSFCLLIRIGLFCRIQLDFPTNTMKVLCQSKILSLPSMNFSTFVQIKVKHVRES